MAHILMVEDEEAVQILVRIILETAGHSVYEAGDGGVALNILETLSNVFDMIILDILMPKMDGFEFLAKLQNQSFHPPVIILSSVSDPLPPAINHLVSGRINKPFSRQQLNDKVKSLLGESHTKHRSAAKVTRQSLSMSGDDRF